MDNNGFSYFLRSGRSSSSAPNAGELQSEQNVGQEQQGTFSGRSMNSCDPESPYLAPQSASRRANPRVTRLATVPSSNVRHSQVTDDPANPYLMGINTGHSIFHSSAVFVSATTDPFEDLVASLSSYQTIDFEELCDQLYSGFGIVDDFKDFFPEESDWWYTVKSGTARSYWAVLSSPTAIFETTPQHSACVTTP